MTITKDQLILLLKDYKSNTAKKELKELELSCVIRQIADIEDKEPSTTSIIDGQPHAKGGIGDKVGDMAIKRVDMTRELTDKSKELQKEIDTLDYSIKQIDIRLKSLKDKEREILIAYYIEGITADDIGNRVYYKLYQQTRSDRAIKSIIERATNKMLQI
jgi:hypothetical protein